MGKIIFLNLNGVISGAEKAIKLLNESKLTHAVLNKVLKE